MTNWKTTNFYWTINVVANFCKQIHFFSLGHSLVARTLPCCSPLVCALSTTSSLCLSLMGYDSIQSGAWATQVVWGLLYKDACKIKLCLSGRDYRVWSGITVHSFLLLLPYTTVTAQRGINVREKFNTCKLLTPKYYCTFLQELSASFG